MTNGLEQSPEKCAVFLEIHQPQPPTSHSQRQMMNTYHQLARVSLAQGKQTNDEIKAREFGKLCCKYFGKAIHYAELGRQPAQTIGALELNAAISHVFTTGMYGPFINDARGFISEASDAIEFAQRAYRRFAEPYLDLDVVMRVESLKQLGAALYFRASAGGPMQGNDIGSAVTNLSHAHRFWNCYNSACHLTDKQRQNYDQPVLILYDELRKNPKNQAKFTDDFLKRARKLQATLLQASR